MRTIHTLSAASMLVVLGIIATHGAGDDGDAEAKANTETHAEVIKPDNSSSGAVIVGEDVVVDEETGFAEGAFPPTMTDRSWHHDAWPRNDCLRCHETGVGDAPEIVHRGLPELALQAKCRTCHVIDPGKTEPTVVVPETEFAPNAFPPMIPDSVSHRAAWGKVDCLMCHENGISDAPIVRHESLPEIALQAKCRTCHVQVRSANGSPWDRR